MTILEQTLALSLEVERLAPHRTITRIAVSKYATVSQMREAYSAGFRDFGENRVQDALEKMKAFPAIEYPDLRWHLIGNLQRNKVRKAVGRFELIHSVDSLPLASAVSESALAMGLRQSVLLQVNLGMDFERVGWLVDNVRQAFPALLTLKGIRILGLMTIAPSELSLSGDKEATEAFFVRLATLEAELSEAHGIDLPELSMGMSHDFPHALTSGATIIRIGNFLFKNE